MLKAIIKQDGNGVYAMIGREQSNGFGGVETVICHGYKGRYFSTVKAAEKSTANYIAKEKARA